MDSIHCTPRSVKRAPFTPLYRREKLCFCTEELGSESISNSSDVSSTMTSSTRTSASAAEAKRRQALHGSLQEGSDNGNLNVRNSRQGGGLAETQIGMKDDAWHVAACKAAYNANLSLYKRKGVSTHVRTFPPPISSLLSDRPIMRTWKFNGRFVLQRMNTMCNSPFSAIRENGRLRLTLASPSSCGLTHSKHSIQKDWNEEDADSSREQLLNEVLHADYQEQDKQSESSTIFKSQNSIALEALYCTREEPSLDKQSRLITITPQNAIDLATLPCSTNEMWKGKPKCKGRLYSHMQDNLLLNFTQLSCSSSLLNITQLSNFSVVLGSTQLNSSSLSLDGTQLSTSSLGLGNSSLSSPCCNSLLLNGTHLSTSRLVLGNTQLSSSSSVFGSTYSWHEGIQQKRKASRDSLKGRQGYAIISMNFGLIILLLENGTMAKGIYLYNYAKANGHSGKLIKGSTSQLPGLSVKEDHLFKSFSTASSIGFTILKPLDLRIEPTCH